MSLIYTLWSLIDRVSDKVPCLPRGERHGTSGTDTDMTQTPEEDAQTVGTPRWVKVFGIVALLVAVLVVVIVVTGRGGPHSPRRHSSSADTTPAATRSDAGPPVGATRTQ
jgi:hypothetical protein